MGNAPILHSEESPQVTPARVPMRWRVFQLRDYRGQRQERGEVLRMAKVGVLTIDRLETGELQASLNCGAGRPYELGVIGIRLVEHGLMLRGHWRSYELHQFVNVPQTWWCVLDR